MRIRDGKQERCVNYHASCFSCTVCGKLLSKGDEFKFMDNQIYCKHDIEHQIQSVPNVDAPSALAAGHAPSNSSFSSSPSSISSLSSTSLLYSNPGSQQQPQSIANGTSHNVNLFSPGYQYTKQQLQQTLNLNKMNAPNINANSNSSFNSFQSIFYFKSFITKVFRHFLFAIFFALFLVPK